MYSCGVVLLVLTGGMLTGFEIRCLHGDGLAGVFAHRRALQDAPPPTGDLLALLEGLLAPEADRITAEAAVASPWLTAARGRAPRGDSRRGAVASPPR